ncbi:MAG: hypothetical protein AAB224_07840 [Gemmatimonadota bacterium]
MKRRSFLSAAALTTAGLSVPSHASSQAAAPRAADGQRDVPRYPQDAWLDQLPGKHRLFLDATDDVGAAGALGYAWNFLRTSTTGYQLKDEDQAVVICLRHGATEFAFSNDIWSRYDVLRKEKYQHPETEKPVKGGNVFRPGSAGPKSMDDGFTWDGLARRGVHFAICGSATRGLARSIAGEKADSATMQKMVDELMANAPANAHFMASGILAAQRAGEYGYTVIKA